MRQNNRYHNKEERKSIRC